MGDPVVHPPVGEHGGVVGPKHPEVRPVHKVVCDHPAAGRRCRRAQTRRAERRLRGAGRRAGQAGGAAHAAGRCVVGARGAYNAEVGGERAARWSAMRRAQPGVRTSVSSLTRKK